ncbi:translocation/assembly module TamB domain-containing protein [Hymenobacter sp. BRD67]|uniref:translocation/assembly module TamB domain-containing protein n=1 Tax=Hymenobacter sp. BRD67 TaxID=2675877 RepID=UPI0015673DC2|nr:translocation/assembly module TamB domain-containing protein [Hymenobacter sp. BRD67]QKG53448.1 translocation/assembly module TamB domain-containing protein [Hymenobacter sp. BRD67]
MRRFLHILLKILLGLAVVLVLAVGGILLALRVPSVQTRVAHQVAEVLTRKLGQEVEIGSVDVRPFSHVLLEGVRVLDRRGGELFGVGQADADIKLFSVFDPRHLHVGTLTLTEPRFVLRDVAGRPDSTTLDQFLAAIKRLSGAPDTSTTSKPFDFQLHEVAIRNGHFAIERPDRPREAFYGRAIDYDHLVADSIYATISQLNWKSDTLRARIAGLRTVETPSQTHLRELTADIQYNRHFWEFNNLTLRVGRSELRKYVRFEYKRFGNFSDFNDSMRVVTQLRGTKIYTDDIAKFAPDLASLKDSIFISGDAKGYVRDFQIKNLDVRYGRRTHIVASRAHADNLPHWRESLIDLRLQPSQIDAADLRRFLPASANKLVQRLGLVKLDGQFVGFYNDFVGKASFDTALGAVSTDVNLKTKSDFDHAVYEGTVHSTAFNVGKFIGDESIIRDVSVDGRVTGTGFVPPIAKGHAVVTVPAIWLAGYRYHNLSLDGDFAGQGFKGKVTANDPAARLTASGDFNLDPRHQHIDVLANVAHANLGALGLLAVPLTVSTTARVNLRGTQLDSLLGSAQLRGSHFTLRNKSLDLDTLDVRSTRNSRGQRQVKLNSELVDLTVNGAFEFGAVVQDLTTLWHEYRLNFESNAAATAAYYQRKRQRRLPTYAIELDLDLKHINPVLNLFVPELQIADNSSIDGSFRQGETSILQLGGKFDSIWYGPVHTIATEFDFTTSKLPYQPEVLAQTSFTSGHQVLPTLGRTEKFVLEGVWDQQRISFSTSLAQSGTTNRANINGSLEFLPRAVQVVFRRSGLHLLDQDYSIAADNAIRISDYGKVMDIQNFVLSHGKERLSAQGVISPDPHQPPLKLDIANFDLSSLSSVINQHLGGRLNMQAAVSGIYNQLDINSTLAVDSLVYEGTLIGQVAGRGDWDNPSGQLRLNLDVARQQQRVLTVSGYLAPGSSTQQFNLTAELNDAPVVLAQPFLGGLLTNLGGTGRGQLLLGGMFGAPTLAGIVDVTDGRFTFGYLGTTYHFADRISFTTTSIGFNKVQLRDQQGNVGTVDGVIRHQGFQNMSLEMSASFRKFQVLHTTRRDNDLYFGTAYATGTATVRGPVDDLVVDVRATSEAGTRLALPLDNAAKAEQASYIKFVSRNLPDSVRRRQARQAALLAEQNKVDLSGIQLNMNLTVTPDAYLEILLDESTGDVIRGAATGQLRLNIDTRGDFNMYGQVEIVRGAYNFTLQGLVNKEFVVQPGGVITWNGDPLDGQMNVTATYTQRTSLAPILQSTGAGTGAAVVPVTAVMNLTGPLLLPVIKLALEFDDAPSSLQNDLASFIALLRNDEQELNRQVFSLLVFRTLSPQNSNSFSGISLTGQNNAVQNSLGQIISSQLGLLTSQIDQNLEIDFNISGLTADQLQALQVRLSYSFLGGRLRLTREGGISNSNSANINPATGLPYTQTSLIGDFSLEYFLRPDGKFRAKLRYETTPRDNLVTTVNQPRAGVSLLHTKEFNNVSELFSREAPSRRERATRRAREVLTVEEDKRTNL